MREDQNIEELFRSSFDDFGVTPPPAVKEAIDRRIAAPWYKRRGFLLFLLLLIGLGSLGTLLAWNASTASDPSGPTALAQKTNQSMNHPSGSSQHITGPTGTTTAYEQHTADSNHTSGAFVTNREGNSGPDDTASEKQAVKTTSASPGTRGTKVSGRKIMATRKAVTPAKKTSKRKRQASGTTTGQPFAQQDSGNASGKKGGVPGDGGQTSSGGSGIAPDTKNTDPVTPVSPDTTDLAGNPSPAADTTPVANPADTTNEHPVEPPAKKPAASPTDWWRVSLYGGPQIAFNQPKTAGNMKLTERPAFQFSVEVNRSLVSGYGLTSGIQYSGRSETVNKTTTTTDTTGAWVYTPIYDPQFPDSIIGYDSVMQYQYATTKHSYDQVNRIQSFGVPLYVTKHFEFGDKWGMLVNLGTIFQFYKVTVGATDHIPAPVIHDFSLNVVGRLHVTYRWNDWMFSAGVNGGWDLKPAAIYQAMDRKRYYLTPQVGVHYSF